MNNQLIQWPRAKYWTAQWNPIIGCKPCSPACEHCYAAAWARRFGGSFEPHTTKQKPPRKGVVFCGNMTDLFGDWIGEDTSIGYISRASENVSPVYLWLTKRPARMANALRNGCSHSNNIVRGEDIVPERVRNHYFGFTAEDGLRMDERSKIVWDEFPKWANLWISCEPLLAPSRLPERLLGGRLKWVVVGCESGPNRRPCNIGWVENIVEQCLRYEVPVFVKQLDIGGRCITDILKFPAHLQIRQVPWAKEVQAWK